MFVSLFPQDIGALFSGMFRKAPKEKPAPALTVTLTPAPGFQDSQNLWLIESCCLRFQVSKADDDEGEKVEGEEEAEEGKSSEQVQVVLLPLPQHIKNIWSLFLVCLLKNNLELFVTSKYVWFWGWTELVSSAQHPQALLCLYHVILQLVHVHRREEASSLGSSKNTAKQQMRRLHRYQQTWLHPPEDTTKKNKGKLDFSDFFFTFFRRIWTRSCQPAVTVWVRAAAPRWAEVQFPSMVEDKQTCDRPKTDLCCLCPPQEKGGIFSGMFRKSPKPTEAAQPDEVM